MNRDHNKYLCMERLLNLQQDHFNKLVISEVADRVIVTDIILFLMQQKRF